MQTVALPMAAAVRGGAEFNLRGASRLAGRNGVLVHDSGIAAIYWSLARKKLTNWAFMRW